MTLPYGRVICFVPEIRLEFGKFAENYRIFFGFSFDILLHIC